MLIEMRHRQAEAVCRLVAPMHHLILLSIPFCFLIHREKLSSDIFPVHALDLQQMMLRCYVPCLALVTCMSH